MASVATALGYSMCTGLIWTIFFAYQMKMEDEKDHDKYSLFGWLFLIALIIAVVGMPMHIISGYAIGYEITKKDIEYRQNYNEENAAAENDVQQQQPQQQPHQRLPFGSYLNAIKVTVLVRSSYLFFLVVGFLVIQFNILGIMIAVFGIVCDYVLLIKYVKKLESKLPFDYLQRAGQLSIFGYNFLPDHVSEHDGNQYDVVQFDEVRVTAMSLDRFGDLEEPMVLGERQHDDKHGNVDEAQGMQYQQCDLNENHENDDENDTGVQIKVREDLLDHDENDDNDEDDEKDSDQDSVR
eukprot:CAMPEP_0202689738 /NCGR_PEP_ID=MMETSP1385-20130828/4933_1 /ASSEMBLY_ACC=CAM_ASM_000861 /TAXON_ID=933848 /ORGANISM="Elphidium margaritaceum" /LENGTH=294 /DNA_ID=CAMNT_0049344917 /DNA_START=516 /DNA_END=1400 /DNA_ORIENTATION=-